MRHRALFVILISMLIFALASPALAAADDDAIAAALSWLSSQQSADGGFSDCFSPASNLSATAEAVIAFAAGGQDAGGVKSVDGNSPLDFLHQQAQAGPIEGIGTLAKVVLALVAAGVDPSDFGGQDLIGQLEAAYDADSGSYGGSLFDQALVILALANAGRSIPDGAADYLMSYQTEDGAWSFMGDTAAQSGDTNTTALVVQALAAAGRADDADAGLAYLQAVQNADGGWPYQNPSPYGTDTDANSTAYVLQALYALGQTPEDWAADDGDPLEALLALQNESGSFSYQIAFPGDNLLATVQAIPAVARVTLAQIPSVSTAAIPGATTAAAPATLPASGGASVAPYTAGLMALGLALVAAGRRLAANRR
jgi:hypothetical protein